MKRILHLALLSAALPIAALAADVTVPANVVAGKGATINVSGSGTLYIVGPGFATKKDVNGGSFDLTPEQTRAAGRYIVAFKSGDGTITKDLIIVPDQKTRIVFQARPSRVPAARPNAISGSAFVLDQYRNLITKPVPVNFQLTTDGKTTLNKTVQSTDGIAWVRTNSSPRAGAAQFIASVGDDDVRRVVQQTASEPCSSSLRMHASKAGDTVVVETDPVRDCSGNPVPDGTIVTFTAQEGDGTRDQVDARVKRGIARAELPDMKSGVITVASGVTLGNQVRVGGGE
jgi:hypothetical protein